MTRKDYIMIAEALRTLYTTFDGQDSNLVARENYAARGRWDRWAAMSAGNLIADKLAKDNPRFDRKHFLAVVRGERDLSSRPLNSRKGMVESKGLRRPTMLEVIVYVIGMITTAASVLAFLYCLAQAAITVFND